MAGKNEAHLTLTDTSHFLHSVLDHEKTGNTIGTMSLIGKSVVIRNIAILTSLYQLSKVRIPEIYPHIYEQIQDSFPLIELETFAEQRINQNQAISIASRMNGAINHNTNLSNSTSLLEENPQNPYPGNSDQATFAGMPVVTDENKENEVSLYLPLNSVLWFSKTGKARLYADLIVYPWDFLNSSQKILHEEVTESKISETASIAKSSVIEGPCIIEDDTIIDDFCKIKGPTYIGKGSYIGMGSLIRNCIFCPDTKIGFHCEVGKSYFAGNDKVSHQNVILDSIIGQNVWFGGYSGTANVQLNRQDVKYRIGDTLVDTGTDHFGAVVGNNCAIGASVIILPGRHVSANSVIQAGTLFGKC